MKKGRILHFVLVMAFLIGVSMVLYPFVSDLVNRLRQSESIAQYRKSVSLIEKEEYRALLEEAEKFNVYRAEQENPTVLSEEEKECYDRLLNVSGNGMMGMIEIPAIHVKLPIFHGTEESVLQQAAGHMEWTSLPVGGENTHCVLSGHSGLPGAKLFTHLDQLSEGDFFRIHVLDEVLTYEVDQILIVLPQETEALRVVSGKDYCTLVTCTPYGINTHRLLVRGQRVDNNAMAGTMHVTAEAMQVDPLLVAAVLSVPVLVLALILLSFSAGNKKKNAIWYSRKRVDRK